MTSSFEHLSVAGDDGGELTPEEQEQFAISAKARDQKYSEPDEESQPSTDGTTEQTNKPEASTEAKPETTKPSVSDQQVALTNEQEQNPKPEPDQQYYWDEGYDTGDFARNTAEGLLAVPTGMVDFGVDLINKVPGLNIPKIPDYENGVAQSIRDVGNVVFGSVVATKVLRGGAGKVSKAVPAIGNVSIKGWLPKSDPLARFLGRTVTAAAGGAAADEVVEFNEQDDNAMAGVKQNAPAWLANRIPMEWTTIGVTNPDIIRERNRNEGIGLSIFGDVLLGLSKVVKAARGTNRFADAMATNLNDTFAKAEFIAKNPNKSINDTLKETGGRNKELLLENISPAEVTTRAQKASLDELGEAALKNDPAATSKPTKGVHDVFDDMESGVRTVDEGGIFGAVTNVAQIKSNTGTFWGRVGSVVSEARLKYGQISKGIAPTQQVVKQLAKQLSDIGDFDAIIPGGIKSIKMDASEINRLNRLSTAESIGEALGDPTMSVEKLFGMLDQFRVDGNIDILKNTNLSEGIDIGIRKLTEEYLGSNRAIASNAVQQSLAGQASDMAVAGRLAAGNIGAVNSVNNQVLERLLYVMTERGMISYRWGATGQVLRVTRNGTVKAGGKTKQINEIVSNLSAKEVALFEENKKYVQTLAALQNTKPEFLKPFMLANEFTGGSVSSIYKLNAYMKDNLSMLTKALVDGNPEMPNQLVQGMWSNIYNSVLSAVATPIKALTGNAGGLIAKPINTLGGAALSGDIKTMSDGWIAMGAMGDSLSKGWDYMREVFVKVSQDPYYYQDLKREDFIKTQIRGDNLEILQTYADAAAKEGEYGPSILIQQAVMLDDLAAHPWLRLGANAMTALDGFTKAVIANGEVRYQAIRELRDKGMEVNIETVTAAAQKQYDKLRQADFSADKFGSTAIDAQTADIALNATSESTRFISGLIRRLPVARPLFMFPTTAVNMVGKFSDYSPVSIFAREANDIAFRPLKTLTVDEMKELLVVREMATAATKDSEVLERFMRYRAEIRGRKAVGTLAMSYGVHSFMNDRITGDGVYDESQNRTNEVYRIPKRSIKLPNGDWMSYDGLGPVSDWIALSTTVMENTTMIGEAATEHWFQKLTFLLSSSLTERSVLANVEPLMGIMNGNGPSVEKLAAGVVNSVIPLAGQRAEWSRLMGEGVKEINREFIDYLRNRNKFATDLPDQYDWLYGDPIGATTGNAFLTLWNAVTPFPVRPGVRPEAEFLAKIEFDARPMISTDGKGLEYPKHIRSEIAKLMADPSNQVFLDQIREEMKFAEKYDIFNTINKARGQNVSSSVLDIDKYELIHDRLRSALNASKRIAVNQLSSNDQRMLQDARRQANQLEYANKGGDFYNNPEFKNFR